MTPLYDYNISVIIGNYLLRALANDEDLNSSITWAFLYRIP